MTGHSKEAKTLERWYVSPMESIGLIKIVTTLIKSMYLNSTRGIYILKFLRPFRRILARGY